MSAHNTFSHNGLTLAIEPLTEAYGPLRLIWLHGWRADKETLRALAQSLVPLGESWLIETPGHGHAPLPAAGAVLTPHAHAEALVAWLGTLPPCPTVLIGHSMGFRIAIHAATLGAPHLQALVAVAGAGVPKTLRGKAKVRAWWVKQLMKFGRNVQPLVGEKVLNLLRRRYESTDAKNCPTALKPLFRAMVTDNVKNLLPMIVTPTLLLYGAEDTDPPPSTGQTIAKLLSQSQLVVLPNLNHYTLLTHGRHVVAEQLQRFLGHLRNS